jgi:hypothetical protein
MLWEKKRRIFRKHWRLSNFCSTNVSGFNSTQHLSLELAWHRLWLFEYRVCPAQVYWQFFFLCLQTEVCIPLGDKHHKYLLSWDFFSQKRMGTSCNWQEGVFLATDNRYVNLGHAHCLAYRATTLDLWLEITKSRKFVIEGFVWITKF